MSYFFRTNFESFVEGDTTVNLDTQISSLFPEGKIGGICMPRRVWKHIPDEQHPANVTVSYKGGLRPKILVKAFNDRGQKVKPEVGQLKTRRDIINIDFDGKNLQAMRTSIQDALVLLRAERTAHTSTHQPLSVSIPTPLFSRFIAK